MKLKLFALSLLISITTALYGQDANHFFRLRTLTAGVTLNNLTDTATLKAAIEFLKKAKQEYISSGYEVQTLRISTQHFYNYLDQYSYDDALPLLVTLDKIAQRNGVILSIGQILPPDKYQPGIADWAEKLVQTTTTISFSLSISSHEKGIHFNSIKAASEIISAISKFNGGEANFRFTASANCPAGIPFFPAAFHADVVVDLAGRAGIVGHAALTKVTALLACVRLGLCPIAHAANDKQYESGGDGQSHGRALSA